MNPTVAGDSCEGFFNRQEIDQWWEYLDQPRDTGNEAHRQLISFIAGKAAEIDGARVAPYQEQEFTRWISTGPTVDGQARGVSLIPYSGLTGMHGVEAPLVYGGRHGKLRHVLSRPKRFDHDAHGGKIVVVEVKPLRLGAFLRLQASRSYPFRHFFTRQRYRRAISLELQVPSLEEAKRAGVRGLIVVLDMPETLAQDQYVPFTRPQQEIPAVFAYGNLGEQLVRKAKEGGARATLVNPGHLEKTATSHLLVTLPAKTDGTCRPKSGAIVVNTHTDGPNRFEDNGVIALWALLRSLADEQCRPRDIVFAFVTGHFVHEAGSTDDVIERNDWSSENIRAALTIEHLGALRWSSAKDQPKSPEPGLLFSTAHDDALNRLARERFRSHEKTGPVFLIKPKYFDYGEGTHLEKFGQIPTIGFLTNPAYMLSRASVDNSSCQSDHASSFAPYGAPAAFHHRDWFSAALMCEQLKAFRALITDMLHLPDS